ncbi:hypothetical protein [Sinomonas sp. G460-2]|uniref:hypothetical protein n=1 Tax=Sinomonas sp. G460-2 TaxID=3393464 RepID=UPI0039EEAF67
MTTSSTGADTAPETTSDEATAEPTLEEQAEALIAKYAAGPAAGAARSLPSWGINDYAVTITGSGAYKLSGSAVAPLVAAARGYHRIDEDNFATVKDMGVRPNTKQGQRMKRTMGTHGLDGMAMPWYSVNDISAHQAKGVPLVPFTYQLRPGVPEDNDKGKAIKYEFVSQVGTPLDVHPGVPAEFIDGAPTLMIAEGLLKGDSALSAYLKQNGASWDDLAFDGPLEEAREKMRALMESIPEKDRVFIFNIGGIYNDRQNPVDWRTILLKNRAAIVAYDADFKTNPHVWRAAKGMENFLKGKGVASVRFLDPDVIGEKKPGVDDFLAQIPGGWPALIATCIADIGRMPSHHKRGEVRVSDDQMSVEEYVAEEDGEGYWKEAVELGGRIKSIEDRRSPTNKETDTLVFDSDVSYDDMDESSVEIEVTWKDDLGEPISATVRGPASLLAMNPQDWVRARATVPSRTLLLNPNWPPKGPTGDRWLRAVKANRRLETQSKTKWMRMGWVPVEGGDPVFIAGQTIVGGGEQFAKTAEVGVTPGVMPVSSSYGVGEDYPAANWDSQEYRDLVASDIREVVAHYVDSGAWTDPATGVLVMCMGLRPVLPNRPKATGYFWGPKGKGKSFTAHRCMQFWAAVPGQDWIDRLPGAASDTAAYMEKAVSQAPIWVVDDLAPSTSQRAAEAGATKLEDLIRSMFNDSGKGRMNVDMTARAQNRPMAQLIVTAENRLATASAMERTIPVAIGDGALSPSTEVTDALVQVGKDGIPARLTAHLIQWIQHRAREYPGRWAGYRAEVLDRLNEGTKEDVKRLMEAAGAERSKIERTSDLMGDVLSVLPLLQEMAARAGVEDELVDRLLVDGMGVPVVENAIDTHAENREAAPGMSLVRALKNLLQSGRAHVVAVEDPSRAPFVGSDEQELSRQGLTNNQLGWIAGGSDGSMRPGGESIGFLVKVRDKDAVLFSRETAFNAAQRAYPDLIPPGQGAASAWMAVWDEGLACGVYREKGRGSKASSVYRYRFGDLDLRGVPVDLPTLFSGGRNHRDIDEDGQDLLAA